MPLSWYKLLPISWVYETHSSGWGGGVSSKKETETTFWFRCWQMLFWIIVKERNQFCFAYIFIHSHHVHKSISKISLMLLHMTSILWLNKLQRPGLHVWWLDYFVQWCSSVALMPYNPLALYTLYSLLKYAPITNTYELHFAPWFSL